MKLSSKPAKGTSDMLPQDMEIRSFVKDTIAKTYASRGFSEIETPCIENLDLLTNSDGGENLRLLFKILKRGEKLKFDELTENALCDLGLRFDLTLPLSRFYADNKGSLPAAPFKAFQIGNVWRAERPQKGRFRQFTQCDVDIIGDSSIYAEIDLMLTVPRALKAIGFENFTVKVSDRRLLSDAITDCGFEKGDVPSLCISLDKTDKIGEDGVIDEIASKGYDKARAKKLMKVLQGDSLGSGSQCGDDLGKLIRIASKYCKIEFDPLLVRGMGYYTGPIFEIVSDEFGASIAGGGRYDGLCGKFQKENVPAVGFSIGFERIVSILRERGFKPANQKRKIALVSTSEQGFEKSVDMSEKLVEEGSIASTYFFERKKAGKRMNALEKAGYEIVRVD